MMRCMLTSNLAVEERFANGTQGRLMQWNPGATENKRRAVPAYHHDLLCRFAKESSLSKPSMCPDWDFIDVGARQENLQTKGDPVMLQLPVVPAYSLTIHKTQALSIKHIVAGCLEGVFALGQVYVLVSRVTDPRNFYLVGLPPRDLLEDIALAIARAGKDSEAFFKKNLSVTNEWVYDPEPTRLRDRIKVKSTSEKTVPLRHKTLAEILRPMPDASNVIAKLLDYIDRVDMASQVGAPKPAFKTVEGGSIFPEDPEDAWWLTDISRKAPEEEKDADSDGPPSQLDENEPREVSDDDPLCSDEEGRPNQEPSSSSYEPSVAWLS